MKALHHTFREGEKSMHTQTLPRRKENIGVTSTTSRPINVTLLP